jgi:hypothetical protein
MAFFLFRPKAEEKFMAGLMLMPVNIEAAACLCTINPGFR